MTEFVGLVPGTIWGYPESQVPWAWQVGKSGRRHPHIGALMPSMTGEPVETIDDQPRWHTLPVSDVEDRLRTSRYGLGVDEAAARLEYFGANELEGEPPPSAIAVFVRQFRSPLIAILVVAAVVTALLDEWIDTWVITAVLLLNAVIGFAQERRAEESVRALQSLAAPQARVIRNGHERHIESRYLVPGDFVLLESGVRVPADLRLVTTMALRIDESLLTGESVPVVKDIDVVDDDTQLADRTSMAYSGSIVASGRGRGYVVATGGTSQLGAIAELMRGEKSPQSPLQIRMTRLAHLIGLIIVAASLGTFIIGVLANQPPSVMLRFAVAMAVSAIPEGLPVVLTITLAVGVQRMAHRNALIRRLAAVETLGSTTVIGSDKTGTLTENRMTVQSIWAGGRQWPVDRGYASSDMTSPLRGVLVAGVLTNEAELYLEDGTERTSGDPTEAALLVAAARCGLEPAIVRDRFTTTAEVPFESERGYSAAFGTLDGRAMVFVKGAPERIIEMSSTMAGRNGVTDIDRGLLLGVANDMAGDGLRVLAMAEGGAAEVDHQRLEGDLEEVSLTLLGLQGMLDPPRSGVAEAVEGCRRAGIRPIMITGDHAATALSIAERIGITDPGSEALTGAEIDDLTDEELTERVQGVSVFARMTPEHKFRVVQVLRRAGEVVAVTGDGVNDAPALRAADIGIAMGRDGTDIAREASDMVLTDDNFTSIYAAVHEGRVVFDNVRKVTFFLLSTGAAGIVALTSGLVLGWPLIMLPTQILWLNLVTNGVQDVAMAFEPAEPGVLDRSPRPAREGVMSRLLWKRTVLVGIVMALGTLAMFRWEFNTTGSVEAARTAALTTMVLFQAFHIGNVRSETISAFRVPLLSNRFLIAAVAVSLTIHAVALQLPFTQFILSVEPIGIDAWFRSIAVASTVIVVGELHKAWERRRGTAV
jgi:cation-transporting P-type ATPase F